MRDTDVCSVVSDADLGCAPRDNNDFWLPRLRSPRDGTPAGKLEERLQRARAASILVSYDPRVGPRLVDLPEQHPVRVAALQGNCNEKASGECRLAISAVVPLKWDPNKTSHSP
jgi:hypothetical protein